MSPLFEGPSGPTDPAPVTAHPPPSLDTWLPEWQVRSVHSRACDAPADRLWAAAQQVRLRDCLVLGRLVRVRIPGARPDSTFTQVFARAPFLRLEEEGHHAISALCGRIWTPRGGLADLPDTASFLGWDMPGTVRVVFAHWCQPGDEGSALFSDVRVAAVDGRARMRLRALEPFISAFNGLVWVEALASATRAAERQA